ncbi:response regulator [Anoxybacterium hadale]|uniref:Response regulator n=1 Tax=Anoxybacterium hadale TaxID=3408580 RepID=A0ACD1A934_9FIRM|nr:response regulator [Clostridiales bacterium]
MFKVLIVDDEKSMRITLSEFLRPEGYEIDTAVDANQAFQMMDEINYDIIVTDIIMPRITGIELLERIRKKSQTVQIIIMTGEPTVDTAVKAVQSGANDYLTKPIKKENFISAIRHAEKVKRLIDEKEELERQNLKYQRGLEHIVEEKTNALKAAMQGIISLLSSVVEARDPYTAGHQRRVGNLSAEIGRKMMLDEKAIEEIRMIGYIHDIGKIAIPAEILSKPGSLTELELLMVKTHSDSGYEMLMKVDLPINIAQTIRQHHERCDGTGYPRGLSGSEISMEAQILMVADVVEAMMSHRPYRPALGLEKALNEIRTNGGRYYNSEVVSACLSLFEEDHYKIDDSEHEIDFKL